MSKLRAFKPFGVFLALKWGGGGLTNERPGNDHVIKGPMRGLEKNQVESGQKNHKDIATPRPKRPKGRFGEKI